MPEKAVFVQISHIAGVVPAVPNSHGGFLKIVEVSLHDYVSLNQNTSYLSRTAFFSCLIVFDSHIYIRQHLPDTCRFIMIRCVERDNRRSLCSTVPFVKCLAVFFKELFSEGIRTFVGPAYNKAYTVKISGLRLSQISPQEARRSDHNSGFFFFQDCAYAFIVKRVCISYYAHTEVKRRPEVYRQAEDVEIRQVRQHDIVLIKLEHGAETPDVGRYIAVGQLNSLWVLFAAAGKEYHNIVVFLAAVEHFQEDRGRQF